jgi:hypothetical protein
MTTSYDGSSVKLTGPGSGAVITAITNAESANFSNPSFNGAAYNAVYNFLVSNGYQSTIGSDAVYWFSQAGYLNQSVTTSDANAFIRAVTIAGLAWNGRTGDPQDISNSKVLLLLFLQKKKTFPFRFRFHRAPSCPR